MIGLTRFLLAESFYGQKYVGPVLLFLSTLPVSMSGGADTPAGSYAACALAQSVCGAWLTVGIAECGGPAGRAIATVHARSGRRMVGAICVSSMTVCLALTALGILAPTLAGQGRTTGALTQAGLVTQLTGALCGSAVGLLCSPLVTTARGAAVLQAAALILAVDLIPALPMTQALQLLSTMPEHQATALELITPLAVALTALLTLIPVVGRIFSRSA